MKGIKTIIGVVAICCLCLVVGCATHNEKVSNQLSESAAGFVGLSSDELIIRKGPPDTKAKLSNGDEVWTYRTTQTGRKKGMSMTIGGRSDGPPPPRPIVSWRENTNFQISKDGIVKSFTTAVEGP